MLSDADLPFDFNDVDVTLTTVYDDGSSLQFWSATIKINLQVPI